MFYSYEDYLSNTKILSIEEMHALHKEMLAEICGEDDAKEIYEELLSVVKRYSSIRAEWPLLSREEKMEKDFGRISCHNSVMTHLNILAIISRAIRRTMFHRKIRMPTKSLQAILLQADLTGVDKSRHTDHIRQRSDTGLQQCRSAAMERSPQPDPEGRYRERCYKYRFLCFSGLRGFWCRDSCQCGNHRQQCFRRIFYYFRNDSLRFENHR